MLLMYNLYRSIVVLSLLGNDRVSMVYSFELWVTHLYSFICLNTLSDLIARIKLVEILCLLPKLKFQF